VLIFSERSWLVLIFSERSWLVAGGWFVLREKYCWLVVDKPSEHGLSTLPLAVGIHFKNMRTTWTCTGRAALQLLFCNHPLPQCQHTGGIWMDKVIARREVGEREFRGRLRDRVLLSVHCSIS
jgi:hypothetical protein